MSNALERLCTSSLNDIFLIVYPYDLTSKFQNSTLKLAQFKHSCKVKQNL